MGSLERLVVVLVVVMVSAGCTQAKPSEARVGTEPYWWDEQAPEESELATEPFYVLGQSSSFLVKGASYARYVFRVDREHKDVGVFFTSTNRNAPADVRKPDINDFDYHFEFMQLRPLGKSIRIMDVNAGPAFGNASAGHAYTLTYIYGRGANYQYVAPFDGTPGKWRLEPGYYELIIATDEKLTVGVNLRLDTPLWTTHYHPQELGDARGESLFTYFRVWPGSTPRSLHESHGVVVDAVEGETLNYFAFANLFYGSNLIAIGPQGTVGVQVDGREVPHRLEASAVGTQSQSSEAYAYAVSFNEKGPARHELRARVDFEQTLSVDSNLAARMLVFAVALKPVETHAGVPRADAV